MIGSPYYWVAIGAMTLVFAVIDLDALSSRRVGRAHGAAIAAWIGALVSVGIVVPVWRVGSVVWAFPLAARIATFAIFVGGELVAGALRVEQEVVRPAQEETVPWAQPAQLTAAELGAAEAYDAQWQLEDRERNRTLQGHHRGGLHSFAAHPDTADETDPSARVSFERLVDEALDQLPADIRAQMSNVAVVVEDEPPAHENLLGLYYGVPLTRRGRDYAGVLPDKITIYRGPLERQCGTDSDRLASEVTRTVWHEIAHHFGISDQRLVDIDRY
jgi:predicted Zn-dependent protease with MMP-like domain